jgi:methionyl-tRNA formyltransferase
VTSVRVVFAGTPEVAVPSFSALLASDHDVVGVLTRPEAPAGRGRRLRPSPVAEAAAAAGVPVQTPSTLRDQPEVLDDWNPDVVAVVAYGLLVTPELLSVPRFGWVNAHFSLLPAWRGAAPVQYAIGAGDAETGVTTFRIEEGLDTGPILMTSKPVAIEEREDSGSLLARLAIIGADLLVATIDALAADLIRETAQPADGVSLAPRITVDDARIDWTRDVEAVDRWIRACTPDPGAWTTIDNERVRIGVPAEIVVDNDATPGEIRVTKSRVEIGATSGYLVLDQVQATGKKAMSAADWARGYRGRLTRAV